MLPAVRAVPVTQSPLCSEILCTDTNLKYAFCLELKIEEKEIVRCVAAVSPACSGAT